RALSASAGGSGGCVGGPVPPSPEPPPRTVPSVRRWQELTGPVAAKGVEDTALYVDTTLVARNEPGCDPGWPATEPEELHRRLAARPGHPLNATSTHDPKPRGDGRRR